MYGQNRYGSNLHQRDARSQLFDGYSPDGRSGGSTPQNTSANGYRSATPNARGQYSASVMEELESQNDAQVEGLSAKVKMLKDITEAIGEEVRSSSTLVASMNDSFDNTRIRLRGTMNNMLRMAERSGVGWRAWVVFILAVIGVFWYVWLF
ncbi:protein transport protein bet1 [Rhizina undulata]